MNSENNNNGTVLGSVNNGEMPNPVPTNGVENLGVPENNPTPVEPVNNMGMDSPIPTPEPLPVEPNPMDSVPVNPTPVNPIPFNEPPVGPIPVNPAPVNPTPVVPEPVVPEPVSPLNVGEPMAPEPQVPPVAPPVESVTPQPTPLNANNPVPPVAPTPAYTNPQMVNPGFESPNGIGSNPPLSFEPEKEPTPKKKANNKLIFIIIVVVVLAGVGFGTYYVLNYTNILNGGANNVNIKTNDLEVNLGDELSTNINDYASITGTDAKNCSLNTMNVNKSSAGVYEYTITCGEMHKTGKITVVDNSELKVDLNTVYKTKGENLEAMEFAKEGSDVKLEFVDSSEVEKYLSGNAGTYKVKLKATEDSKSSEVEGKLIVLENELKGFLTCTSTPQDITDLSAKMTVGERFAIVTDGTNNIFGNFAQEVHTFDFSEGDASQYDELLEKYNNGEDIELNNITGEVSFNDNKTITITNDKSVDELNTSYGADNLKTYSSIRTYFTTNLKYECKFSK